MARLGLIIFSFFAAWYLVYFILAYRRTGVPYIRSPRRYFEVLLPKLDINSETIIYDLGCGRGDFLFAAEKYNPKKLVGYELAAWPLFLAGLHKKLKKSRAQFYKKDFFGADISKADIIYLFLVPKIVNKAWPFIKDRAKKGCKVVVLSDKINGMEAVESIATTPGDEKTTYYNIYVV